MFLVGPWPDFSGRPESRFLQCQNPTPDCSRAARPDASGNCLSAAELAAFARDGYIILRGVMSKSECERLLWERIAPALARAIQLY